MTKVVPWIKNYLKGTGFGNTVQGGAQNLTGSAPTLLIMNTCTQKPAERKIQDTNIDIYTFSLMKPVPYITF